MYYKKAEASLHATYIKGHSARNDPEQKYYLNFLGLSTLIEATSPQFLQKVIRIGDPNAIIDPIGLILA